MKDIKFIYKDNKIIVEPTTISSVTGNIISFQDKSISNNELKYKTVVLLNTECTGYVVSNTSSTITVDSWKSGTPTINDKFIVEDRSYSNKNKFYYAFRNEVISGKDKLIQDVIKPLLTKKGSNLYNIEEGSSFITELNKKSYSTENSDELKTILIFALNNIKDNIITKQTNVLLSGGSLTDSEILTDIVINNIEFNNETFAWDIEVILETKGGDIILGI